MKQIFLKILRSFITAVMAIGLIFCTNLLFQIKKDKEELVELEQIKHEIDEISKTIESIKSD